MRPDLAPECGLSAAVPDVEGEPLRILVANVSPPTPDRDSGSLRLFRFLELLVADGHRLTLICRDGYNRSRDVARLTAMGIDVHPVDLLRMRELGVVLPGTPIDVPTILAEGRFDVALLSFFHVAEQYLPLLRAHSPLTRVVIDTVDVHHVRERRGAELSGSPAAITAAQRTREREQAIYCAADALVAVSAADAVALSELAPDVPRFVVSNIHAPVGPTPSFEQRRGLVFVGSFPHLPNVDAVLGFQRETWPLVRAALRAPRLTIVGTEPPPEVARLADREVTVTGWVPEVAPHLDAARVSIAPLRYGAGVKGKIGEALSRGLPVVTTTVGAEGMDLVDGEQALVADSPEDFAAAVARLHEDRALWERMSAAGRAHIEATLGIDAARASVRALLAGVVTTRFVIGAGAPGAAEALLGFARAFGPGDPTSLTLTVDGGDPAAALADAAGTLAGHDLDPDATADIEIVAGEPHPLPARTVRVGAQRSADASPQLSPDADPQRWRELARVRPARPRRRPEPTAVVVVHAVDDAAAIAAQLQALRDAQLPDDAELVVVADACGVPAQTVLRELDGDRVRVIRATTPLGRHAAWRLGALDSRAPHAVLLSPLALPRRGFVEGLLSALRDGAALAGPLVAGAAGLRAAVDGSLWPRADADDGSLDALALDCLAVGRELLASGLPRPPRGEGMVELGLAGWAREHGDLAVAPTARVDRLTPPPASVIVCTRNRADELPDCIGALLAAGAREIVVVDNDSSDATPEVLTELAARAPGVVRIVAEPRGGLCHARNAGAAAATHDLLLYLDDDARPGPGWLEHAAHALARPGVANAGGPVSALWPPERGAGWPGRDYEPYLSILDLGDAESLLAPPHFVYGANWGIRRTALAAVGGFDPSFGPGPDARINGDEVAVAAQLHRRRIGHSLYCPGAAVGHRISPERIDDRFLLERAVCVGVEQPRHELAIGDANESRLIDRAEACGRALAQVPALQGTLTVAEAVDRIAVCDRDRAGRMSVALSLGELSACAALLGESEVLLGSLTLRVDGEAILAGRLTAPAAA